MSKLLNSINKSSESAPVSEFRFDPLQVSLSFMLTLTFFCREFFFLSPHEGKKVTYYVFLIGGGGVSLYQIYGSWVFERVVRQWVVRTDSDINYHYYKFAFLFLALILPGGVTLLAPFVIPFSRVEYQEPLFIVSFCGNALGGGFLLAGCTWIVDVLNWVLKIILKILSLTGIGFRFSSPPRLLSSPHILFIWSLLLSLAYYNSNSLPPVISLTKIHLGPKIWPPCLDGYRIAVVSDGHLGPQVGMREMKEVWMRALREEMAGVDLLVLVGDMFEGPFAEMGGRNNKEGSSFFEEFKNELRKIKAESNFKNLNSISNNTNRLSSKFKDGIYMVSGNHEVLYPGWEAFGFESWRDPYSGAMHGVTNLSDSEPILIGLDNGFVDLPLDLEPRSESKYGMKCDKKFRLIGVPDFASKTANLKEVLERASEDTDPIERASEGLTMPAVLISHQSRHLERLKQIVSESETDSKPLILPSLMIHGHTHGGTMWPIHIVSYLFNNWVAGARKVWLNDFHSVHQYSTPGICAWGHRYRLGSRAEIPILELRSSVKTSDSTSNFKTGIESDSEVVESEFSQRLAEWSFWGLVVWLALPK